MYVSLSQLLLALDIFAFCHENDLSSAGPVEKSERNPRGLSKEKVRGLLNRLGIHRIDAINYYQSPLVFLRHMIRSTFESNNKKSLPIPMAIGDVLLDEEALTDHLMRQSLGGAWLLWTRILIVCTTSELDESYVI